MVLNVVHPDTGTSWQRVRRCGSGAQGGGTAANAAGCTVPASAVLDSDIVVRQPGSTSDAAVAPEPCTLTVRTGAALQLLLVSLLGAALLLRGQRWCRSRACAATIRACCVGLPLVLAVAGTALLASTALVSTAAFEWLLSQLPAQPPK